MSSSIRKRTTVFSASLLGSLMAIAGLGAAPAQAVAYPTVANPNHYTATCTLSSTGRTVGFSVTKPPSQCAGKYKLSTSATTTTAPRSSLRPASSP